MIQGEISQRYPEEQAATKETEADRPNTRSVTAEIGDAAGAEARRAETAAERLRNLDGLKEDKWKSMDVTQRAWVLNAAGKELAKVYDQPPPPLMVKDLESPAELGAYGDGQTRDFRTGTVEGADYGITMNARGEIRNENLFGDDPRTALHTYAHEYRHSYQWEQARRVEMPQFTNLVDDPKQAGEWRENLRNYTQPEAGYDAYFSQTVEADARRFADEIVSRVFR